MTRQVIKENAKAGLRFNYWPIIGFELVAGALMGGGFSFSTSMNREQSQNLQDVIQNSELARTIFLTGFAVSMIAVVLGLLYTLLFANVINVSAAGARLEMYQGRKYRFVQLFSGLKQYKRNVGTMALYTLFTALGFCCFIVPGIIVALGLFEVPYLLADDPNISGMDAIRKSWEDMKGHKGELFVFGLSFIGWFLLSGLTFGVLAIFYVGPYYSIAEAGFYHELKKARIGESAV